MTIGLGNSLIGTDCLSKWANSVVISSEISQMVGDWFRNRQNGW